MDASEFAYSVLKRLPYVMIKEPERVLISYFSILVGIMMMVPIFHPPSIDETLDAPLVYVWAVSFLLGGIAKITALMTLTKLVIQNVEKIENARLLERTGASLIAIGCFVYAITVLSQNGISSLLSFSMFLGIAATNLIRLGVSVANGHTITRRGA